jgi:putative endonuclease
MSWFLYVIECADGSLYTGIATDPQARYAAHAAGKGARYTRSHPPAKLLMTEPHADRSSALKAEYAFKRLSAAQKRRRIG